MRILITGGAGYIGTHLVVAMLESGHDVVVLDNLSTGNLETLARAERLAGRRVDYHHGDVADASAVAHALDGVEVVFHLAGSKQVAESVSNPAMYLRNNVGGMSVLLEQMDREGVRRIVFSSSAAVYGSQSVMPLSETAVLQPSSPYGRSKWMGEQLLGELATHRGWSAVSLRYFNPVGAHPSGILGEPLERAMSLVPRALQALLDPRRRLTVFGSDYDTPDGTCLRDYIHVCDLSRAHIAAMGALQSPGHHIYNVGTGHPYSVREVLDACAVAAGRPVPAVDGARRPGDIPMAAADCRRFQREHGFKAQHDLQEMVDSAWRWASSGARRFRDDGISQDISLARRAAAKLAIRSQALRARSA